METLRRLFSGGLMLKKILILINSLYLICLTGPMVLNYLPHYDQLARVYAFKRSLEGFLSGNYGLVFSLGYLVCLLSLGLAMGKKTKRNLALASLALVNLALCLPLLYDAARVLIF